MNSNNHGRSLQFALFWKVEHNKATNTESSIMIAGDNSKGKPLTQKEHLFIETYVKTFAIKQSAMAAGMTEKTARSSAWQFMEKQNVVDAIKDAIEARKKASKLDAELVLRHWWDTANVDVNELVEYRRSNCRNCWGVENNYQWTHAEYLRQKRSFPDIESPGGFGFVPSKRPNPECPECHGDGIGEVFIKDSRDLSDAARKLYGGAIATKNGHQLIIANKEKALENVARHLGMFIERQEHTGRDGLPIQVEDVTAGAKELLKEKLLKRGTEAHD